MKRKISLSTGTFQNRYGDLEMLDIAKHLGLDAVDFDTCGSRWDYRNPNSIFSKSDDEIVEYFTKIRRRADELGIEIGQTHGRLPGFKNDPVEDDALIENARRDCLAASVLGAPVVVIHSVTTIFMGKDADPRLMHDLNFDMFNRMLPFAKQYGVKLASETFGDAPGCGCCDFFGNADELIASFERVCSVGDNAKYMSYCMDTGHTNKAIRFGNPTPGELIRRFGKNLSVLHLHDNDGITDQHKLPMTGTIDWNDVFNALDEVGYSGTYNLELQLHHFGNGFEYETAEFSVKLLRHMLKTHYGDKA